MIKVTGWVGDQEVSLEISEPKNLESIGGDMQKAIRYYLRELDCEVFEDRGIWTVKAPDGTIWDFTTPQIADRPLHERMRDAMEK